MLYLGVLSISRLLETVLPSIRLGTQDPSGLRIQVAVSINWKGSLFSVSSL